MWNEISSLPKFIWQFDKIFGFKVANSKEFLSKFSWIIQYFLGNIWQNITFGGSYSTENKIYVSSYMVIKVKSDINELKPVLKLRFIAEMELRKRQGKLIDF